MSSSLQLNAVLDETGQYSASFFLEKLCVASIIVLVDQDICGISDEFYSKWHDQ